MNLVVRYKSAVIFSLVLAICVGMSIWLSHYIPDSYFDNVITPILVVCLTFIGFFGAWLIFRHSDGLHIRKVWGYTLLVWGMADGAYLLCWIIAPTKMMDMSAYQLTTHELLIGNLLGWVLLLYPTEALRPRWLTLRRALWQLLPMCALVVLDYAMPFNLAPLISLYPFILLGVLIAHIRAYRVWCEENFSTLDDIDVQWIVRYFVITIFVGIVYLYMCLSHSHTRGFTQLWLVAFMLICSTEQILFRRDPWEELSPVEMDKISSVEKGDNMLREKLEQWMEREKPYTNPDFRLMDLQLVLPMNRTYLSQFIHTEYDSTFYQFVNRYRIEEAKRLKQEQPELKIAEISARCGFSSPTVFSRTFTNITGLTPREWAKKIHSA